MSTLISSTLVSSMMVALVSSLPPAATVDSVDVVDTVDSVERKDAMSTCLLELTKTTSTAAALTYELRRSTLDLQTCRATQEYLQSKRLQLAGDLSAAISEQDKLRTQLHIVAGTLIAVSLIVAGVMVGSAVGL